VVPGAGHDFLPFSLPEACEVTTAPYESTVEAR
jgi:hypothetical protein